MSKSWSPRSLWDKVHGRREWALFLTVGCSTFSVPRQTEVSKGNVGNQHDTECCPWGVDTQQRKAGAWTGGVCRLPGEVGASSRDDRRQETSGAGLLTVRGKTCRNGVTRQGFMGKVSSSGHLQRLRSLCRALLGRLHAYSWFYSYNNQPVGEHHLYLTAEKSQAQTG